MGMNLFNNSASFSRPAGALTYGAGNLVANSATAGSVVPMAIPVGGFSGFANLRLVRARLSKSTTTTANANFRVHLYSASPTCANGDGAAWSTSGAANWLGNIDVTSMLAFTDGATGTGSLPSGSEAFLKFTNGTGQSTQFIYALLQAQAAYVAGASETFTLTLEEVSSW